MRRTGSAASSPNKPPHATLRELMLGSGDNKDGWKKSQFRKDGGLCLAVTIGAYCALFLFALATITGNKQSRNQPPVEHLKAPAGRAVEESSNLAQSDPKQKTENSVAIEVGKSSPTHQATKERAPVDFVGEILPYNRDGALIERLERDMERGLASDGEPWEIKRRRWNSMQLGSYQPNLIEKYKITIAEGKFICEDSLDRFRNQPHVTIRGFYSSGTNWLRALISRNCRSIPFRIPLIAPFAPWINIDSDGMYGWKHGLFLEREVETFRKLRAHSMIIIVREAPTWAVSAWKMNAMAEHLVETEAWKSKATVDAKRLDSIEDYFDLVKVNEYQGPHDPFNELYFHKENMPMYTLNSSNIFEARDKVQKNWLTQVRSIPDFKERIEFVRYEDLLQNPAEKLQEIAVRLKIPCKIDKANFESVSARIKMGIVDGNKTPQAYHARSEFCKLIQSQTVYRKIIGYLDLEFEKNVLGYDYPSTLQEYCDEALRQDKERLEAQQ